MADSASCIRSLLPLSFSSKPYGFVGDSLRTITVKQGRDSTIPRVPISIDPAPLHDDVVHVSAKHALEQSRKYARWLDSQDPVVVANAMLLIIGRALNMLKSQIDA